MKLSGSRAEAARKPRGSRRKRPAGSRVSRRPSRAVKRSPAGRGPAKVFSEYARDIFRGRRGNGGDGGGKRGETREIAGSRGDRSRGDRSLGAAWGSLGCLGLSRGLGSRVSPPRRRGRPVDTRARGLGSLGFSGLRASIRGVDTRARALGCLGSLGFSGLRASTRGVDTRARALGFSGLGSLGSRHRGVEGDPSIRKPTPKIFFPSGALGRGGW